jgi:hypothetical protein
VAAAVVALQIHIEIVHHVHGGVGTVETVEEVEGLPV